MEIEFESNRLSKLMNNSVKLSQKYGPHMYKKIRQRLDDLEAADCLEEMRMLPGECHELTGDRSGQLALHLVHPQRLVFEPADNPPSVKEDEGIDWPRVKKVRILEIVDYH